MAWTSPPETGNYAPSVTANQDDLKVSLTLTNVRLKIHRISEQVCFVCVCV